MISKKELDIFGGKDLVSYLEECLERIKRDMSKMFSKTDVNVYHIDMSDLDAFKKSVEQYAKRHKNAKIKASAFIFTSDDGLEEYNYEE